MRNLRLFERTLSATAKAYSSTSSTPKTTSALVLKFASENPFLSFFMLAFVTTSVVNLGSAISGGAENTDLKQEVRDLRRQNRELSKALYEEQQKSSEISPK